MKTIAIITIITIFLIIWAMCKAASDSDDGMDE